METHCDDELEGTKITLSGLVEVLSVVVMNFMNKLVASVFVLLAQAGSQLSDWEGGCP